MLKSRIEIYTTAALGCLLATTALLRSEDLVRYRARPLGNKVLIEGTSNIHDWTMDGELIGGFVEVPKGVELDSRQASPQGLSSKVDAHVEVSIPVTSIKNSEHEGMSETMQDAMKATEFSHIKYHLTEMKLKEPHAANTPLEFDTKGDLIVAGVTNQISMPVRIETLDDSKLKITGSVPMKMTDYGIKPPVKLGVFRTADPIKISFEWMVGKQVLKPQ